MEKLFGSGGGVIYKPVEDLDLTPDSGEIYVGADVKVITAVDVSCISSNGWVGDQDFYLGFGVEAIRFDASLHFKEGKSDSQGNGSIDIALTTYSSCIKLPYNRLRLLQFITYAELKEPPVFVPSHPCDGIFYIPSSKSSRSPSRRLVLSRMKFIVSLVLNAPKSQMKMVSYSPGTLADHREQEVKSIQTGLSPPDQVQLAAKCLPPSTEATENTRQGFRRWTIQDYSRAYSSGETTPTKVAERFLAAVNESSMHPLNMSFFINYNSEEILKQAAEATRRYEKGEPISILDGVPIAIKDEIDCLPYPTTGGTKRLHKLRPCTEDACCVERLKSCGAVIVGKTNMHELGVGTSGINPHYGKVKLKQFISMILESVFDDLYRAARNPYDPSKISGGSSSGSAAVVSAGLCPVALGVDGGGSVRMPAALCGVVGFKPTFERVPHSGVLPLNWTVGMVGVLASTVEDSLIVYAAISGQLSSNPTALLPTVDLPLLNKSNFISKVKMAKYREWFNDCNNGIRECCDKALDKLCSHYGWETVEVTIPEIEVMRLAHYTTIGSECTTALSSYMKKLKTKELGWDARVALRVYRSFSSKEYLMAQRIRSRQMHTYKEIFKKADVIVSPTTGYQIAGNFLGLPAVTVPVGYDKLGMPIGLQLIGKPWSESTLIRMSFALQELCSSSNRKPKVFYDLLGKA
ncbi:hypothetical protein Scep_002720 [Stephania cephalantha]|uniref:Amidase domain-containing protein n=1 Tax=Stephania cephalantha TaxID=152367 RepID=A0AAP0Q659_9MAGN